MRRELQRLHRREERQRTHLIGDEQLAAARRRDRASCSRSSGGSRGVITNSDYYLEQIPRYVRGEMTEPCRSGMRTIHIDPTGHVKRCPDFPTDFHWTRLQAATSRSTATRATTRAAARRRRRSGSSRVRDVMATAPQRRRMSDDAALRQRVAGRHLRRARRARGAAPRCATPAFATDVAVAVQRRRASPRRADARRCATRYPRRRRSSTAAAACSRPGSSTRTRTPIFGRARYEEQELRAAGRRLHGDRAARRRHPRVGARPARAQRGRAVRARRCRGSRGSRRTASTTVEVKSGYGLIARRRAQVAPRRSARLARAAAAAPRADLARRARDPARVSRARRTDAREYVDAARRRDAARRSRRERLARFADVFCEPGVFTVDETREILAAARERRTGHQAPRRRARAVGGGAELAAELGATSADHLAAISRRRNRGARRVGDRRDAAARHDALPRQDRAGAGARAHRGRGASRSPRTSIRAPRPRQLSARSSRSASASCG